MKRLRFLVICALVALLFTGCGRIPIIGGKYVVTEVEVNHYLSTRYRCVIRCLDKRADAQLRWDGNKFYFYTDVLYSVGDTITIK